MTGINARCTTDIKKKNVYLVCTSSYSCVRVCVSTCIFTVFLSLFFNRYKAMAHEGNGGGLPKNKQMEK